MLHTAPTEHDGALFRRAVAQIGLYSEYLADGRVLITTRLDPDTARDNVDYARRVAASWISGSGRPFPELWVVYSYCSPTADVAVVADKAWYNQVVKRAAEGMFRRSPPDFSRYPPARGWL